MQDDLIERLRESRRRLEAEIRERLSAARVLAEEAFARARMRHAAAAAAVRAQIETLETLRHTVGALVSHPVPPAPSEEEGRGAAPSG
jgi:hypothetical protein